MTDTLTINPAATSQTSKVTVSKTATKTKNRLNQNPSALPIAIGTSSICGAILASLWKATRYLSPWLGVIGTICIIIGTHFTGNNKKNIV